MTINEIIMRKSELEKRIEETRSMALSLIEDLELMVYNNKPENEVKDKQADLDNVMYEYNRSRFEYKIFMETEVVQKD